MDNSNETTRVPFNFTYYAMKLLGKNLYSNPWTAISELVANGIDSKADSVHVLVDMRDKRHAVVEIFDNGMGMSYLDLKDKYTIVGRNKRESKDNDFGKTLGRKGIGKLAALYLSPEYYLYTKNGNEQSAWRVNTLEYDDNDIPSLDRVSNDPSRLIASQIWNRQKHGTMVHLSCVDLQKIGEERLKRLPANLADYYLPTVIPCRIMICILQSESDEIEFVEIKKKICFETLYAIFDTTGGMFRSKMKQEVYLTKALEQHELDRARKTVDITRNPEEYAGFIELTDMRGKTQRVPYELSGWIGIHCSIDNEVLIRNSIDGKRLRPNALRLYVRGKLAVDNLMNYIKSTQAFANYVEGEISFDILDDDNFEDASTSSREGYSLSDPRIIKLIEICKRIVRLLIDERISIGNRINKEIDDYNTRKIEESKEKEELALKQARIFEQERDKAEEEKKQAQAAQQNAEEETRKAKEENYKYKEQNRIIFETVSEDQESFAEKVHLVKTNALSIRNNITTLGKKIGINSYREIGSISISAERILSSIKYSDKAKFSLVDEYIDEDIFMFCEQFVNNILAKQYHEISFVVQNRGSKRIRFSPQNMALILDNLVSNSKKSHSTVVNIVVAIENERVNIIYNDNGSGIGDIDNVEQLFEFGWSNTGGTGIGLYNIKRVISRMKGRIEVSNNVPKGATFRIIL